MSALRFSTKYLTTRRCPFLALNSKAFSSISTSSKISPLSTEDSKISTKYLKTPRYPAPALHNSKTFKRLLSRFWVIRYLQASRYLFSSPDVFSTRYSPRWLISNVLTASTNFSMLSGCATKFIKYIYVNYADTSTTQMIKVSGIIFGFLFLSYRAINLDLSGKE